MMILNTLALYTILKILTTLKALIIVAYAPKEAVVVISKIIPRSVARTIKKSNLFQLSLK